jgi:hypothetical protein
MCHDLQYQQAAMRTRNASVVTYQECMPHHRIEKDNNKTDYRLQGARAGAID